MNDRVAAALAATHALAIGLGLVQQAAFAIVFGVTPTAGMFALAITPAVVTAMIYTESLQVTLLPELLRGVDNDARIGIVAASLGHAAILALASCAIGLAWGGAVAAREPIDWPLYAGFVVMLSLAHGISMAASAMLVWLQAERRLVLPSTVHLIPGVLGTIAILASANLAIVALAYIAIGAAQVAWLASLSSTLRTALATIARGRELIARAMARLPLSALMIGAALPLLQCVDRLARGLVDLADAAAASYAWAITLGLAATIARGPAFAYSLFVASGDLATRRRTFAFPLGLYALGLALGALVWSVISVARVPLLERWPSQGPLIEALATVLPQLLLCLAPIAALPSLYRVLVRLSSARTTAGFVAWQFAAQVALAAAGLMRTDGVLADYSAAIAANLAFAVLLIMTLRLHASATRRRSTWPQADA